MEIDGLGSELIEQLVANGNLEGFADFFDLELEDIANITREVIHRKKKVMQRVGDKVAAKIIKSIGIAKSRGLASVLAGIGIAHVGGKTARDLAVWARDIDRLMKATPLEIRNAIAGPEVPVPEDLFSRAAKTAEQIYAKTRHLTHVADVPLFTQVPHFASDQQDTRKFLEEHKLSCALGTKGKAPWILRLAAIFPTTGDLHSASKNQLQEGIVSGIVACSVYQFMHSATAGEIFRELRERRVKLSEVPVAKSTSFFAGKKVVITGSFASFGRPELTNRLIELGPTITGSVSENTDLVLAGTDPGSKWTKAKELGTTIWTEEQLLDKLRSES